MIDLGSLDRTFQNPLKFWRSCISKHIKLRELHRGKLLEVVETGMGIENNFILTKKYLIKLDESGHPNMMTSLEWKHITCFQENLENSTRFGFSLGCKSSAKDFYVENEDELNNWISHLSKIGIMTDIQDYYTFEKIIGKGSNSTVYLGKNVANQLAQMISERSSTFFAIKSISKKQTLQTLESIASEIKIMRKLNHPNIVNLHQVFENETHIYMVLDYVEGGNLYEKITRKKTLPEALVMKFCREFLNVLKYLNSKKIIHRDIKLENILLNNQDDNLDFKLADFGLATRVADDLTVRCGSPGYIAPEVLKREKYGQKVDIFGIGIVVYILLTGKMPFFGYFQEQVLEKNKECNINFHIDALQHVSKESIDLLQKMTSPCPKLRISPRRALKHKCFLRYIKRKESSNQSMSMYERKHLSKSKITLTKSLEISQTQTIVLQTNFAPMKRAIKIRQELMKMIKCC